METMDHEEDIDEDDVAAGEALTGPLSDAFSGLQGEPRSIICCIRGEVVKSKAI